MSALVFQERVALMFQHSCALMFEESGCLFFRKKKRKVLGLALMFEASCGGGAGGVSARHAHS